MDENDEKEWWAQQDQLQGEIDVLHDEIEELRARARKLDSMRRQRFRERYNHLMSQPSPDFDVCTGNVDTGGEHYAGVTV